MSDRYSFLCRHGNDMSMRRRCVEAGLEADTHASASAHSETTHLANLFFFLYCLDIATNVGLRREFPRRWVSAYTIWTDVEWDVKQAGIKYTGSPAVLRRVGMEGDNA